MTPECGRHQKDEVSGYLHCKGDPDDYSKGFVQHQGPLRGQSGKDQGGCRENAGTMGFSLVHSILFIIFNFGGFETELHQYNFF